MGPLAALALHGVLASTGPVPDLRIDWSATESCPSPGEILRRTERFLGARVSAYGRELHVEGWVEAGVGGQVLELSIAIDGRLERHELRAIDCERLGTDAALLIASALDPFALGPAEAALETREWLRPFDRLPPIQHPRGREPVGRPSPPPSPVRPEPEPTGAPAIDVAEPGPAREHRRPARPPSGPRGFVGGAGLGFAGVFPSPSGGVALEGGLERGRLRWQLGAQGWFGGRFRADTAELGANLTGWTGSTAACFVPRARTVSFPLCATIGAGAMIAAAVGTVEARRSVQPWAFVGVDLRTNWSPRPSLGLYVGLAVLPALARPSWSVTNPDASFRVPALTGLVRLGVEWRGYTRSARRPRNSPSRDPD